MSAAPSVLRIGLFGGGTVGGGVYQLLTKHPSLASQIVVEKICVRNLDKPRDYDAPADLFTTDPSDIYSSPTINCVVEVMGGTTVAKTVVETALKSAKPVVTANKALLAAHLEDLRQLAVENHQPLLYEAAVCGGIPIIHLLRTAYPVPGDIRRIQGIMNGTTNFMLTAMEEGADYGAVLQQAQDLGYAEADPTADVEGHDVRSKLALLTKLAFGTTVAESEIHTQGISQISALDFQTAKDALQSTIKLLGTAELVSTPNDKTKLVCTVLPTLVKTSGRWASISGSGNAVAVTSDNLGTALYTGPGAGRFPTAHSIVADIVRLAQQQRQSSAPLPASAVDPFPPQAAEYTVAQNISRQWYLRWSSSSRDALPMTVENIQTRAQLQQQVRLVPVGTPTKYAACFITKETYSTSQMQSVLQSFKEAASSHNQSLILLPLLEE